MSSRRALVIGGSLGGLIAAHLMRSIGWDVVVFERNAEELASRGVGLGTHQQLIDILRRAGIDFDDSMGIKVADVICLDRDGRIVLQRPTARTMSGWGRLYHALRDALPDESYRLNMNLRRVEPDGDGVTAIFADGSRERADLLIGADGLRSTVREQFLPQAQPLYAGYVAWRALIDERDVPPGSREIFEHYTFCLPEGEQMLGYPVPGRNNDTAVGRRGYNIVWYRPTEPDRALVDLLTDANGRYHAAGIPPPLIRPDVIAAIKATARALIAPQIAELFSLAAAVLPADLRSRIVAARVRARGARSATRRSWRGRMSAPAPPRPRSTPRALPIRCVPPATTSTRGSRTISASRCRSAARWWRSAASMAPISAPSSSRAKQRSAAELNHDVEDMFNKHFARSDQVRQIVNQSGLAAHSCSRIPECRISRDMTNPALLYNRATPE